MAISEAKARNIAYNTEKQGVLQEMEGQPMEAKVARMTEVAERHGYEPRRPETAGVSEWGQTVTERPPLFPQERPSLFQRPEEPPNPNGRFNRLFSDMMLSRDTESFSEGMKAPTNQVLARDQYVQTLMEEYEDDEFKRKSLGLISEMPQDEQIRVLTHYMNNRDWKAISGTEALLIHVMRSGMWDITVPQFNKLKETFSATERDAFRFQLRDQQVARYRAAFNDFAAKQNIENAWLQVAQQDFAPLINAITRITYGQAALDAANVDIAGWRSLLPGEVRQELRAAWAGMDVDERVEYINQIGRELQTLKDGKYGPAFTEYGVMEMFVETFTDDLLENNVSKNTLDRVFGNLDVVFELVYGIGVIGKLGGRGIRSMYRAMDGVQARQAARVAGNTKLMAKLDRELGVMMREAGIDPAEAAWTHMPRPPSIADDIDVLPDGLRDQMVLADRVRERILQDTDDITGIALTTDDKISAVRRTLSELDHDNMVVHPQMGVLEALPNDTGFKYRAVYGQTEEGGWSDLADALDEALVLDPELRHFKVARRNQNGTLEIVGEDDIRIGASGVEADIMDLESLADDELILMSKLVPPDGDEFKLIEEEAMRRATDAPPKDARAAFDGEEYFLVMDHERFWSVADKNYMDPSNWRHTGRFSQWFLNPSIQFGDEIFQSFDRAYRIEQGTISKFEILYKPYYDLGKGDKRVVSKVFEWIESEAKRRNGIVPNLQEITAEFENLTTPQLKGLMAVQQGMNVQWEMFNRRLYREFANNGYLSARPVGDADLPRFHGAVLERGNAKRTVYDPLTQEQRVLTKDELDDIYDRGGAIMKLDTPLELSETKASTHILIDNDNYRIGRLDNEVLEYHPGYYARFYDDPYFIVKRYSQKVDGNEATEIERALRTAGSQAEANRFLRRFARFDAKRKVWVNKDDPTKTYRIARGADLNRTESSLFTKDTLHREGRLFWDKRNADRLPDVNGNAAELEDPVLALDRSTTMATRQNTHEDMIRAMKRALFREYKDILGPMSVNDSLSEILEKLGRARKSAAEPQLRKQIDSAIAFVKYLNIQHGTDEAVVPMWREMMVRLAGGISNIGAKIPSIESPAFKISKVLENYASRSNPLRTMRSITFNAFMVFRPVRQLLLQSAQISYLSGIDPAYVLSGRVIRDGRHLRAGLVKQIKSGYDDGLSLAQRAKAIGLTKAQYKRLVNEFDRSGLLQTVDVHAFSGHARRIHHNEGVRGSMPVRGASMFRDWLQRIGFDTGEQLNVSFTYMLALRRYMRQNSVDDLMKLSKSDWDKIGTEAQSLALGMTKPNKMWYQSGTLGTATQFLSFGHKAFLGVIGKNPAIKGNEAFRIAMMGYLMFGTDIFGASEWVRGWSANQGIDRWMDKELPGGDTLHNILTRGLVSTMFNAILEATLEHHKDMDFSFLAPGANMRMLWEEVVMTLVENPWGFLGGPTGSLAAGGFESIDFIKEIFNGAESVPMDQRVFKAADQIMRGTVPIYNDAMTAKMAYNLNQWYTRSGRALPVEIEPVISALLGRTALGMRTLDELAYWQANNILWQTKENMQSIIKGNREHLIKNLNLYYKGELSREFLRYQFELLMAWSEDWPEHLRYEIFKQSMVSETQDGVSVLGLLAENMEILTPDIIALLDEFTDLPPKQREELQDLLNNLYDERSKNNVEGLDYIEDTSLWQN